MLSSATALLKATPGFLGTRASFLSDLLLLSLIILVPAFVTGFILARRRRGSTHRLVMLTTYSVVVGFVIVYIIHNLVEGFPPFLGPRFSVYNIVYLTVGITHSILATAALAFGGYQLFTGYTYSAGQRVWAMPGSKRRHHRGWGHRALVCFGLTAATGIFFYFWVFVYASRL